MTRILTCSGDPKHDEGVIREAAEVIRAGGLVAMPTETVYGLAGNALDPEAIAKIYAAKGRPSSNPLIVHAASLADARNLSSDWPESAEKLGSTYWPGPLTLIVPKRKDIPDSATAGLPSVALRVPSHPIAQALIRAAGVPLAAPSANPSEALSPTRAHHVARLLGSNVDLIVDAGPSSFGIESTVVDCTGYPPRILRPGPIGKSGIEQLLSTVSAEKSHQPSGASPGRMVRHYAPKAALKIVKREKILEAAMAAQKPCALLVLSPLKAPQGCSIVSMPKSAEAYAAALFTELHRMEEGGIQTIIVEELPDGEAWDAVRDRLSRAAAPSV